MLKQLATEIEGKIMPNSKMPIRIGLTAAELAALPSGSFKKADAGKPRLDLISPEMMTSLGDVLSHGANKYGAGNWEAGAEYSRYFAAAQRHLWAWQAGEDNDPESGLPHLSHAVCCLMFLLTYQARDNGTDNRGKN